MDVCSIGLVAFAGLYAFTNTLFIVFGKDPLLNYSFRDLFACLQAGVGVML